MKTEFRAEFVDALLEDSHGSRRDEPGCLRFDVLVDADDPNRFLLFKEYVDQAAVDAHVAAPHFQRIGAGMPLWLARPGVVVSASVLDR